MPQCSVTKCPNNSRYMTKKDGVSYFSFPRNPVRCSEWTAIIAKARDEINYKPFRGSVVCSNHFPVSNIYTTKKGFNRLNKSAKPILHLSNKIQAISNYNSDQDNIHNHSDQDKNEQPLVRNEESVGYSFNEDNSRKNEQSPSTSVSIGSILDTPRKIVMKKKLNLCEKIIQNKNRQINRLQKQNKRLIKKNITIKNTLKVLRNRKGIDESLFSELSQNLEVTEIFNALYTKNIKKKKRPFSKYPPAVRKFALTFHFYSPSAYKYVRRLYNTCLPHPNTLCNWYRSISAEPGFTVESFDRLNEKSNSSDKQYI